MRLLSLSVVLTCFAFTAFAQTGTIQGRVVDSENNSGIPFANVVLMQNGLQKGGGTTDMDGYFKFKNVAPGTYDIVTSYVGYNESKPFTLRGVMVSADKTVPLDDIKLSKGKTLKAVDVVDYEVPVFEKDQTTNVTTLGKEDIEQIAYRSAGDIVGLSPSVIQVTEGSAAHFRGGRDDANQTYIDGMKAVGSAALPKGAIEQISTLTGGIPARYGDAIGGVVNITTRGAAEQTAGGLELVTSRFLDPFGYNLAGASLTGPLWKKGNRPLIGYFVSGEFLYEKDPNPSAIGVWKIHDDTLAYLRDNPLVPAPLGSGFVKSVEYVDSTDLVHIKAHQNTQSRTLNLSGKLDFSLQKNMGFTLGSSWSYDNFSSYVYEYALFNPDHNPKIYNNTIRTFGRFTHNLGGSARDTAGSSRLQNMVYSVQLDYTKFLQNYYDPAHKYNTFDYGYIGKFKTYRAPVYSPGDPGTPDSVTGLVGWTLLGYMDTLVTFDPGTRNPYLTKITEEYFRLNALTSEGDPQSLDEIQLAGGLLNGERLTSLMTSYALWYIPGRQYNGYGKENNDQLRFSVHSSVDINLPGQKKERNLHSVEFGVEYEQLNNRSYGLSPVGLWEQMRLLANRHIQQLDKQNPVLIINGQPYAWNDPGRPAFGANDTIFYNSLYVEENQAYFDKSLRQALGLPVDGLDWLDVDSISPETFRLDMFSADELLNNGLPYVSYIGYDFNGNRLSKQPGFNDFFTQKDENGNYVRGVGSYRPIYTAAYVQDKFAFRDLIFNIGVRVDRFDANQKVMKDPYSLYAIRSKAEVSGSINPFGSHPANIGDDYAVYVNDINNPTKIAGYRDGDTWYDAAGNELANGNSLADGSSSGKITPYLVNPDDDIKSENFDPSSSFKDYDPQVTVMPRVAFSFPLSDEAIFYAHYDQLTQRPKSLNFATPIDYYYFEQNAIFIANPALKPEKTTDYEVGYKQELSRNSGIGLSAFYRELRDMIQTIKLNNAYPATYVTAGNLDFSTVKGFSVSYDLRRKKSSGIRMLTSYSLQFADGTGSSSTSQYGLINADQPNLKAIFPLSYDRRHSFNTIFDYRFGEGGQYAGPTWFGKKVFENAGANFVLRAGSGVPFSQYVSPVRTVVLGTADRSSLEGTINGSRLPWSFQMDAKIEKDFLLQVGKKNADKPQRSIYVNAYLWVQNVLNNKNVVDVYAYTGSPSDDGYLSSAVGQENIQNQLVPQAYEDQYRVKMNNPGNYSLPRRIRLGLGLNF